MEEIHLAIGRKNTPSVFDCDDLIDMGGVTRLELLNMKPVGQGAVSLHYKVQKE